MTRWLARLAAALMVAGVAMAGIVWMGRAELSAPGPAANTTTIVIPKGVGTPEIGRQLAAAGLVDHAWLFMAGIKIDGGRTLKAGEYAFPAHVSMGGIIDMMRKGEVVIHKFTLAEGLTVAQATALLRGTDGLAGNIEPAPEEGTLLPETYQFLLGDLRMSIITRMHKSMTETLDDLWAHRKPGLPIKSEREALILASIVERETALPTERPHIAAVFENRLRQGMKLQSDPTVIYALSHGVSAMDRALTLKDLEVASPFNTYVADGLPPGPICNPGRASLQAVLDPDQSDDLYFVADGTGGHVFAKTLADHNKNVQNWRAIENSRQGQAH